MKLLLLLSLLLTGCGKDEPLSFIGRSLESLVDDTGKVVEKIARVPRLAANKILGTSDETDEDLRDLEKQVDDLRSELESEVARIESQNLDLYLNLKKRIRRLSRKSRKQLRQIRQLSDIVDDFKDNFITVIDPCGDSQGFDEVLLKLYDGSILAFFDNSDGFIAELQDGNYTTTDGTNCNFSIDNGNVLD